jgi:hypothetical protein
MTETTGSFLDIDTSDAMEPAVAPEGEHLIRCIGYRKDKDGNIIRKDKNSNRYFMPLFDFPQIVNAKSFSVFMKLPESSMDAKTLNSAKWELEVFKKAMGVTGAFNLEELEGKEAWALITKTDDATYGEQNNLKKFIAGA